MEGRKLTKEPGKPGAEAFQASYRSQSHKYVAFKKMRNRHNLCNWTSETAWLSNPGGTQGGCMFTARYWQVFLEETIPEGNLAVNLANSATVRGWGVTGKDVLSGSFGGCCKRLHGLNENLCQKKQKDLMVGRFLNICCKEEICSTFLCPELC